MAKVKTQSSIAFREKPKVSRPGIQAKTKESNHKKSKNYKKAYRGQGR
jgi:hypothetical protein